MIRAETTPERRALTLLRKHLTEEQKLSLRKTERIEVKGSLSGTHFLRVQRRGKYRRATVTVRGFCCAARGMPGQRMKLPWPDQMLAFKLQIETDEAQFRKISYEMIEG